MTLFWITLYILVMSLISVVITDFMILDDLLKSDPAALYVNIQQHIVLLLQMILSRKIVWTARFFNALALNAAIVDATSVRRFSAVRRLGCINVECMDEHLDVSNISWQRS